MKGIRKPSSKLEKELATLRKYRGELKGFVMNFLTNFRRHTQFMHNTLKKRPDKDEVLLVYEYYIVSMVSSWETFYRDLFIFAHTTDTDMFETLLKRIDAKKLHETMPIEEYNFNLCELTSKSFNFQNLDSINEAFLEIFPRGIINTSCLSNIGAVMFNNVGLNDFAIFHLFQQWEKTLKNTFNERHQIIHNSNYRAKLAENIELIENLMLLVPQISATLISKIYGVNALHFHINKTEKTPFFFTIEGFISTDWKPADKPDGNFIKLS